MSRSGPCGHASTPNYNRINEWPLQFLRTGYYDLSYGYLHARTTDGLWWSATAGSATYGRNLGTHTGGVNAQSNYFRGSGFALRCVVIGGADLGTKMLDRKEISSKKALTFSTKCDNIKVFLAVGQDFDG